MKIYKAYFNKDNGEIRLKGKVVLYDSNNGIPGIEIFKASEKDNRLLNRVLIGESNTSQTSLKENGLFDVTFNITNGESLFFYNSAFYIVQFNLSNLLDK